MTYKGFTDEEIITILTMYKENIPIQSIADELKFTYNQVRGVINRYKHDDIRFTSTTTPFYPKYYVTESPMPIYNTALEQTGDCLILPDTEFPYHHAEFINRCLDLAATLEVKNCTIAGDVMHFDSISHWEANWKADQKAGISDKAHAHLYNVMAKMTSKDQSLLIAALEELEPQSESDIGSEVTISRKALNSLAEVFDDVVYVIGNHDGRLLSALNSPMFADQLKQFVIGENPKYRIAPFYYSILHTIAGDYRITHPTSAAQNTAVSLATQFHQHIIMGHSHNFSKNIDPSGQFWAIQSGCCVDEERLAYASQRDRGARRHALGAVLVYNGYPYDLSMKTDFTALKKIK